jgi:hypothetical protein
VATPRPEVGEWKHQRGGFATYGAADVELTLLRADRIRGDPQPNGRDTFAAYAQRWVNGDYAWSRARGAGAASPTHYR